MSTEITPQPRKKNWLCIFPGCNEPLKTHYNCYSHVWDGHLRHLAASPLYGGVKGEVYKKLSNRSEVKKQCETYMIEVLDTNNIEEERAAGRARLGNPQLSLINSIESESTGDLLVNQNQQQPQQPYDNSQLIHPSVNQMNQNVSPNINSPLFNQTNLSPQMWDYITNDVAEEQLQAVLQQEDFIRIVQMNENLKRLHVFGEVLAEGGFLQRSDKRSKEQIQPLVGCLETVLQLTGKSFKYIGKNDIKYGFIAQEVQEICPELVHEDDTGFSVDVIGVIPMLVEALKDIHAVASETKDDSSNKFEELTKVADSALERVKQISKKIEESEDNKKEDLSVLALRETNHFNFSMGPAITTLFVGFLLTLFSGYLTIALPVFPAILIYCWILTVITWVSCWRNRSELTECISKRKLILYWKKENSILVYISIFLGILIVGMSIIMGKAVITLSVVCVSIFFVLGGLSVMFLKRYKLSFSIIFSVLLLFLVLVAAVVVVLFIVQPNYQCSINDNGDAYTLTVTLDEMSPKQIISELPWNCWSSSFEFSQNLPPGFFADTQTDSSYPFISGVPKELFPTTSVSVYVQCVDFVQFYCGTITFQICGGRSTEDDCVGNGCSWDDESSTCQ